MAKGKFIVLLSSVVSVFVGVISAFGQNLPSGCIAIEHITDNLSHARSGIGATTVWNKAIFAGGWGSKQQNDVVDIYDCDTDSWSTATLSTKRGWMGTATVCKKAIFAGGHFNDGTWDAGHSTVVDVYNCDTDTWSTADPLSEGREYIGSTVIGNKAFFAGGHGASYHRTPRVDIYECVGGSLVHTWGDWLSVGREMPAMATVGDYVIVAGGRDNHTSTTAAVDYYDNSTGQWHVGNPLSLSRAYMAATSVGDKAIFAGGVHYGGGWSDTDIVDIYDVVYDDFQ